MAWHLRILFVLGFTSLGAWMPSLTIWLQDQGFSGSEMGWISAIPWLVMLLIQPLWGIAADRYGKKRCLLIAASLAGLLFCLVPAIEGRAGVAIMITLVSFVNTPVLPLLDSIALDTAEDQHRSYAGFRFWGALGFACGAYGTSFLIGKWGSDTVMYASAISLIFFVVALVLFRPASKTIGAAEMEFTAVRPLLSDRRTVAFLVIVAIVSVAQSSSSFFLTVYLRDIGASENITGIALAVQALSELPFYAVAVWLLRKMVAEAVIIIAIAATAIRLLLYSLNTNPEAVIAIETMNGMTWTLLWIGCVEFIDKRFPSGWRTTGQSMLWAAYFGAGAIGGNLLSGYLYEKSSMHYVFAFNAAITACAIFVTISLYLIRKKSTHYERITDTVPERMEP